MRPFVFLLILYDTGALPLWQQPNYSIATYSKRQVEIRGFQVVLEGVTQIIRDYPVSVGLVYPDVYPRRPTFSQTTLGLKRFC